MTAYQSAASALVHLVFPWGFLLVLGAGGAIAVVRAHWPKRRGRRLLLASALGVASLVGAAAIALGLSPARAGTPAVMITAEGLHCSPWRDALAWPRIAALETRSEKSGYGWRPVGVWLGVRDVAGVALPPPRPLPFRLAEWLSRADPTSWTQEPSPAPQRYCNLDALDVPVTTLIRAIDEAWRGHRGGAALRP